MGIPSLSVSGSVRIRGSWRCQRQIWGARVWGAFFVMPGGLLVRSGTGHAWATGFGGWRREQREGSFSLQSSFLFELGFFREQGGWGALGFHSQGEWVGGIMKVSWCFIMLGRVVRTLYFMCWFLNLSWARFSLGSELAGE